MILDSLDALVYVADMETHELLFVNRYGQSKWGSAEGRKCWEVLQSGQAGPCEFCTNAALVKPSGEPGDVHIWEFQNSRTGRWYQCRDRAIRWVDGRLVRLEIATDITDRKCIEDELAIAKERAESLASTDELTGLNNRRAFFELGIQQFKRAGRSGYPMAVVMFDIDHFKQLNDGYGHFFGDTVLRALAATLRPLMRSSDIIGRLGGEEFGIVLPETDLRQALVLAERLRAAIADLSLVDRNTLQSAPLPNVGEPAVVRCTASFGVAVCADGSETLETLLQLADQALFKAKRGGRNRIVHEGRGVDNRPADTPLARPSLAACTVTPAH